MALHFHIGVSIITIGLSSYFLVSFCIREIHWHLACNHIVPITKINLSDNTTVSNGGILIYHYRMIMSSPPHPLMHFGMAGWLKIRNEETAYYKPAKPEESPEWPPKYWKFALETAEEPKCEAAFVDLRRFARIRLIDCAADQIRNVSPLVENGPDPVIDKDIVTEEWLAEKLGSKHVPIKALLLDQANISGIGNWVGWVLLNSPYGHGLFPVNVNLEKQGRSYV